MEDLWKAFVIILVISFLLLSVINLRSRLVSEHEKFFEYWTTDCRQDGGEVQATKPNYFECFKDGNIINHVDY